MSDLELLALEMETCLVMTATGRFARENSPDENHIGPRVAVWGCGEGVVGGVRADVDEALAHRVFDFIATAPPWTVTSRLPPWIGALAALVGVRRAALGGGPAYILPNDAPRSPGVRIVQSGGDEAEAMLARFAAEGMPPALAEAGYVDTDELWPPWCAAMVGDEVAALCCAARLGARGAEAGLYTFPAFRGQGLGAAVTAAWSAHPALADKTLFYSTAFTNRSSQRVTQRLGLRQIGASARID
ncbi:MAG TPA: GNAT family N-acetyltransferase [Caulobacteraceae bacterium]|nr:GNAT family N-acetyltransferase [Caulobacteraceae bacterium]